MWDTDQIEPHCSTTHGSMNNHVMKKNFPRFQGHFLISKVTAIFGSSHVKNIALFFLPDQSEHKRLCIRTTRGRRAKQVLEKYTRKGQRHEVTASSQAFQNNIVTSKIDEGIVHTYSIPRPTISTRMIIIARS